MNSIAVVGMGFVGKAVFAGMQHRFTVYGYDKKNPNSVQVSNNTTISCNDGVEYISNNVDGPIFVCVPTPMNPDGSCNIAAVESVVLEIDNKTTKRPIVVIKSTVPPGTTALLNEKCAKAVVCFNPEFLRELHAEEDFKNQDRIVIGGPTGCATILKQLYYAAYPHVPIYKTSSTLAELVKYVTNCFLAVKVSYANEIKQICDKLGVQYTRLAEIVTADKRLGTTHWDVPGHIPSGDGSGKLLPGFGGKCLCKDINGLIHFARVMGVDAKILSAAWEKNLEVRPGKDWEKIPGVKF